MCNNRFSFSWQVFFFFTLSQCSPLSSSQIMREQTLPRFKSQTGLLPGSPSVVWSLHMPVWMKITVLHLIPTRLSLSTGMLKRSKYSRLRNDSLTSLEDRPLKRDLCLDSDFAQLDPGAPTHHGPSTLRDFIPRMANIRLQSPVSLRALRGQTAGPTDRPLSTNEWGSGPDQRFCSQPSLNVPLSTRPSALSCTKRPITLHRMASLPSCPTCSQHRDGLCCLKTSSAANRAVHHHIKVPDNTPVTVHDYTQRNWTCVANCSRECV